MMKIRKFINREKELEALEKEYQKESFSLFVIYGRRRVGKTELLRKFGEGKPFLISFRTKGELFRMCSGLGKRLRIFWASRK